MDDGEFPTFTKVGALRLASKVQLYWTMRGASGVRAWVEEIPGFDGHFQIRSNISEIMRELANSNAVLQRAGDSTVH